MANDAIEIPEGSESQPAENEEVSKSKPKLDLPGRLRKIEILLNRAASIVIKGSVVFGLFILIVFAVGELANSKYTISEINVPASFSEAGYSHRVIGNRIIEVLFQIVNRQRFQEEALQYSNSFDESDVTVEVVGTGLPIRAFIDVVGSKFGLKRTKPIRLDIALDGDSVILFIKVGDHSADRFDIPFNGSMENTVGVISTRASETILKYSSPYLLARHYLFSDSEGCFRLGRYLLDHAKGNDKMERVGYFAKAGGFLTESQPMKAEKVILEGLEKYPHDINLNAAYGTILEKLDRPRAAVNQHRKVMAMVDSSTPLLRRTLCFNNLGTSYALLKEYDSSIYFFNKAIESDPDLPFLYLNLAKAHLSVGKDTTQCIKVLEPVLDDELLMHLVRDSSLMSSGQLRQLVAQYR